MCSTPATKVEITDNIHCKKARTGKRNVNERKTGANGMAPHGTLLILLDNLCLNLNAKAMHVGCNANVKCRWGCQHHSKTTCESMLRQVHHQHQQNHISDTSSSTCVHACTHACRGFPCQTANNKLGCVPLSLGLLVVRCPLFASACLFVHSHSHFFSFEHLQLHL